MDIQNQILCGNHLELLPRFPDDCFDMWLTSPPYDNLRDYEGYDFQFEPLARELYRVLKPGCVGVWIVNDATVNGSETLTSSKQKIFFSEIGFNVYQTIFYAKTGLPPKYPNILKYQTVSEYNFVLAKGKPLTFHPIKDRQNKRVGEVNAAQSQRSKDGHRKKVRTPHKISQYGERHNIWFYDVGFMHSTLDREAFDHPAIFPEKLAEDHILSWSNPGDVILDPMCGSGTTCKMAAKHGRQYVGIDIAEKYCEIARKRVALIEAQPMLFQV
jgi:DNA modification methylase